MSNDVFDIIDQLLANDGKVAAPKPKKRGRPKGSKNKSSTKKKVAVSPNTFKHLTEPEPVEIKYVTETEWDDLGRPQVYEGYTTNRLQQWKYKTRAYYEVRLEFFRAAIQFIRLSKAIDWYKEVDEKKLELCRQELKSWRKRIGISHHEMSEVISIAYDAEYKRKRVIKKLRSLAIDILDSRKEDLAARLRADPDNKELLIEKKSLTLNSVAQVPANIRPRLLFVKVQDVTSDDDILGALADASGNPQLLSEHACAEHPTYRGLRKARNGCPNCFEYWHYNKQRGVREKRVRA